MKSEHNSIAITAVLSYNDVTSPPQPTPFYVPIIERQDNNGLKVMPGEEW